MIVQYRVYILYKCTLVCISKFPCYGCWLDEITGSKAAGGVYVFVVCMLFVVRVETSATGRSFVQGDPAECLCVCVCD
jgi:hypothetical protein